MKHQSKVSPNIPSLLRIIFLIFLASSQIVNSQSEGKKLFEDNCADCHSIGEGTVVGPDLKNITQKRSEKWLIKFIKSPESVIEGGDKEAKELYEEFDEEFMPDQDLTEAQIKEIITFIKFKSSGTQEPAAANELTLSSGLTLGQAGEKEILKGKNLFSGVVPFSNNGAACLSCHNVTYGNLLSGGSLARDLTKEFSRLKPANIYGIITNPPFPVMKAAYKNNPITKDEAFLITAFLKQANAKSQNVKAQSYAHTLLLWGIAGAVILFGLSAGIWKGRKTRSVNWEILNR